MNKTMDITGERTIVDRDLQHFWHPGSQMKDYESFPPMPVQSARGSYIYLQNGHKLIDAFSSWWCKSLGHNHPRLKKAAREQIEAFEHVILANTTNEAVVELSEKLTALTESLSKAFYVGDGSCATEVALKMSLHMREIEGRPQKNRFMALENGYHGETAGALSVSDLAGFKKPYESMLFNVEFLGPLPYVNTRQNPLWQDCAPYWPAIEQQLEAAKNELSAVIVEPIVQGAGYLRPYSKDFLRRLRRWCTDNDVHLIADEIMTGMWRTGKALACQHADIEPDFACLSKGLTSGWLPFSAVLTTDEVYNVFYGDYGTGKTFLHSHTYSGHPLGARLALETLKIMEEDNIAGNVKDLEFTMIDMMREVGATTGKLDNVRGIGAIVAADLVGPDNRRLGYEVFQTASRLGALLRPIGNTLYWMPPLNIDIDTLNELKEVTEKAVAMQAW